MENEASRPGGAPVDRRSVLRLLGITAIGLVTGCRSGKPRGAPTNTASSTPPATRQPRPTPTSAPPTASPVLPHPSVAALSADQLVAQRVAAAEQALLVAYDTAAAAHPELADRLAPFRADHAAHLQGLVPGAGVASSSAPPNVAPASAPVSSAPASIAIFQQLADLERGAAAARVDDVVTTSGSLARLIASIGGCEAAHAALLSVAT